MTLLLMIPPLIIIGAFYGATDVTQIVQNAVHSNMLIIGGTDDLFGDSVPGYVNVFVVYYRYGNSNLYTKTIMQGNTMNITHFPSVAPTPIAYSPGITILSAVYGPVDVTAIAQSMVAGGSTSITALNSIFGDTLPGNVKTLTIAYRSAAGLIKAKVVSEGGTIVLD